MGDVLSQDQIDKLLGAMKKGEKKPEEEKKEKYKLYDFKSPKKFTKEDLKIIHDIFDVYSRLSSSYLTGETRKYCQVKVVDIQEQRYYEFSNALQDYVIMGMVNMGIQEDDISESSCLIQLTNELTFSIYDLLLGGTGKQTYEINGDSDFTEMELAVMKRIMTKMTSNLKEAWADYLDIKPYLMGIETNSRINKLISGDETVVLVTIEIEIEEVKSYVNVTIPAINMEEMMTKFSDKNKRSGKRIDHEREMELRKSLLGKISDSKLEINAILTDTKLDLGELLALQIGDIVQLDMPITKNVSVLVNNNPWYEAKLGNLSDKKALKIVGITKHGGN
ncbi:MAG: FliM/FliN family flagellar motor switch protein [Ruminococcus sp.]|nr:FliM/FliN family flagellar motor switch protein [Ruminococcus sp.]